MPLSKNSAIAGKNTLCPNILKLMGCVDFFHTVGFFNSGSNDEKNRNKNGFSHHANDLIGYFNVSLTVALMDAGNAMISIRFIARILSKPHGHFWITVSIIPTTTNARKYVPNTLYTY